MRDESHTAGSEIHGVVVFVGAIWLAYAITWFAPGLDRFGIIPRTWRGLIGIGAAPFLHASLWHLIRNTIPLFILLVLLAGSCARSWEVVLDIILLGGLLLWLFGRNADHIGASGLVFGLIGFLVASGFLEKRIVPLMISLLVGFLYGGSLIRGVIPGINPGVSWDGHLFSAIAGVIVAYLLTHDAPVKAAQPELPGL